MPKIIAVIPTYNEAGNIQIVIDRILTLKLDIGVLVVDDFSPDGTYKIVEEISKKDKRVNLLVRKDKRGRGWAGIDGFKVALELGADMIVEMDGDLSHSPKYIPAFVEAAEQYDVVIGSRYVEGGKDEQRTFLRNIISEFARKYLALVLGVKLKDPASGFRLFKREVMVKILPHLKARDPFVVTESLHYIRKYGFRITEVPIEFMARGAGVSKLKPSMLIQYLFRVWKLKLNR
ncbi:MAG: polyprenol monophosphomannose synthase [Elusimicrobiota bacterium]